MRNEVQKGKPVHQPTITSPGRTKMTPDSVPAADATVCTMLFSRMDDPRTKRRTAMEITAAGIDDANVSPTFRPRYTFAAVNTVVMSEPSMSPRRVSSEVVAGWEGMNHRYQKFRGRAIPRRRQAPTVRRAGDGRGRRSCGSRRARGRDRSADPRRGGRRAGR